jgi:protein-tyrosine phosphatase
MNRNMVHFIASDAHDTAHRPPVLRGAYDYVVKTWGALRAETLFVTSPRAVITGARIVVARPGPAPRKRKWYRLGF